MVVIHRLPFQPSAGLLREIEALESTREELMLALTRATTLEEYCNPFLASAAGREYAAWIPRQRKLKILDLGFGRGESSLYAASLGHEVHAVEPSLLNCEILQQGAQRFGLSSKVFVYQAPAEEVAALDQAGFDLCLFNSSLHHCDDPLKALKGCRAKLGAAGRVIAINEPLLKFYRSQAWFRKALIDSPLEMGHYGGNEHIYSFKQYVALFEKAGLSVAAHLHNRYLLPRQVLADAISQNVGGRFVHSDRKLLLKLAFLLCIKTLLTMGGTRKLTTLAGKKLSLLTFTFEGKGASG